MKIVILRFSSIGDIVLTTPVIRCLKQQLNAEIHYVLKEQYREILAFNPYVDKIWTFKKDINEISGALINESFDHIVDLHRNLRTYRLKKRLKKPSTTFPKLNIEKWLLVKLKWNRMPEMHIVDRYFVAVKSLGVNNDGLGLDFMMSEEDELKGLPEKFACLVIGANHKTKQIPVDKCIELIERCPIPVVLIGGEREKAKAREIENLIGTKAFNKVGSLSLQNSARWIAKSEYVITSDTGMMHIAAALKKPIAVLWGSTTPEFGMAAYYPKSEWKLTNFEILDLPCRPCSKLGFEQCPKGHFKCMNDISASEVILSMKEQI